MICFIALPIFIILSIFSAKYRTLARAALDCTLRRLTLRPCQADLETQVRTGVVGWMLPRFPAGAKFVHQHFDIIGNFFTLLFVVSAIYTLIGVYNFVSFGTCDPADPSAFCLYRDLLGGGHAANLSALIPPNNSFGIVSGNASAPITVLEFGCLTCPYTKRAEAAVSDLLNQRGASVHYVFKPFPLPTHNNSRASALALLCSANPEGTSAPSAAAGAPLAHLSPSSDLTGSSSYWAYRAAVFDRQESLVKDGNATLLAAAAATRQPADFYTCFNDSEARYGDYLNVRIAEGNTSQIYGTPTFFVSGPGGMKPLVGPIPADQLIGAVDAMSRPKN